MEIKLPVTISAEMWATVIEQFLMLILIIGRWLLPKGDLTREQLSQLLVKRNNNTVYLIFLNNDYR